MFKFFQQFPPHFDLEDHKLTHDNYRDDRNKIISQENVLYFWGFYLGNDMPKEFDVNSLGKFWSNKKVKDILIYYIGTKKRNVTERLLQHFSALFGGYYTIISCSHLKKNNTQARLRMIELLWSNKVSNKHHKKTLEELILHTSESLSSLRNFHAEAITETENDSLQDTLKFMKERLIFDSINFTEYDDAQDNETLLHNLLTLNVLGGRGRKKMKGRRFEQEIAECYKTKLNDEKNGNILLLEWITETVKRTSNSANQNYVGSSVDCDYYKVESSAERMACSNCNQEALATLKSIKWRESDINEESFYCAKCAVLLVKSLVG
jgi:hypothetical protein